MNHQFSVNVLIVLTAVALVGSCGEKETQANGDRAQAVTVRIETVVTSTLFDAIQVAGTVKADEDVYLSPEEGGVVKEWKVRNGDHVKKGDLIVVLRDEVIKASYQGADAQARIADLNVTSQKGVYDQQGISEVQYKTMQFGRDAARANADLMKARWERTQLRSPIDGVLDNTVPNEGEFAPPGVPIAHLVNLSALKIQAEVPERFAGAVRRGTHALITFGAMLGDTIDGTVSFVSSTVSTANRAVVVEIGLPNPVHHLKPEMVATVRLLREAKNDAIMIRDDVVQLVDRDRIVTFVENGGKAEERRLKLGGRQGNRMEVLDGLKPGDRLIVTGYQKLVQGTPVIVAP